MREILKEAETKPEYLSTTGGASQSDAESDSTTQTASKFPTPVMAWSNTQGKIINASAVKVEGGKVIFDMGGREIPYLVSDLSPESQGKLRECLGE